MIAGIHISQEMFAIDIWTAVKPFLELNRKHVVELPIKTSPAFPLHVFTYSYRLFGKFNKAALNYSLEALCRFPGGGYIHTALETV